jgi:hypothetical protein
MLCKIWGFHGSDYEECHLMGYINTVRTSQETHYISDTELIQLMLCKIWGFHGGDYEECRLLGYINPVRTSQETHYISDTEPSRLMLRKILRFHGDDWRMASSGMLWRVALVKTEVSRERSASFIRVTRNGKLGTTLAVTNSRRTLLQVPQGVTSQKTTFFFNVIFATWFRTRNKSVLHHRVLMVYKTREERRHISNTWGTPAYF